MRYTLYRDTRPHECAAGGRDGGPNASLNAWGLLSVALAAALVVLVILGVTCGSVPIALL